MDLIYTSGSAQHGTWFKGYYNNWEYSRNGGSYDKNIDFWSIHWETTDNKNDIIKLHVELPRFEKDPVLNMIKQKYIIQLLFEIKNQNIESDIKEMGLGTLSLGRKLAYVDTNKCSEAFRIKLSNPTNSRQDNIKLVDSVFRPVINSALSKIQSMLDDQKLIPISK